MKNPNGFGSVVKLSGNRRRPYAVRKTVGFNEKGHPIYVFIGYTPTREEGLVMLAEFNKNPYNIEDINITTKDLYKRWFETQKSSMSKALQGSMQAAWKHCSSVYDLSYRTLKSCHIQDCINSCPLSYSTKASIKNLFTHLDTFAMELDIITRRRALMVKTPTVPESSRKPFGYDEICLLWENAEKPWIDTVLIFIYTGMRLSELLNVSRNDINLDNMTITGGTKTAAGKNRVIPIHPKILPFIKARLEENGEYLITYKGKQCSKTQYYTEWGKLMSSLNFSHTPHECRHTFRSLMDSAGANKRCIDLIMGHKSKDVGERVYTHKTVEELFKAVCMIE